MRSILFAGILGLLVANAGADERPACSTLLYDDAALLEALPPALRPIVESARVRGLVARREAAWATFHRSLDWGLKHVGQRFAVRVGDSRAQMRFERTRRGDLQLRIDDLSPPDGRVESNVAAGLSFLDFVAAELGWIAKARARGDVSGLTVIGVDVREARLANAMASLGFQRGRAGLRCYTLGLAGGIAGFLGGQVYFARNDADVENGSIYEDQRKYHRDVIFGAVTGAGGALALACFRPTGRNYTIEFDPAELPVPAPRPAAEATRS